MLVEGFTHRRAAERGVECAVPGGVGDDILVTCDRDGDGHYEVVAGIRSPYLQLPRRRYPAAGGGARTDWHRAVGAAKSGAVRVGGEGTFRGTETRRQLSAVRGRALPWRWRLHVPQTGTLEGRFEVTVLRADGAPGEGWIFELGSMGPLSFRAR